MVTVACTGSEKEAAMSSMTRVPGRPEPGTGFKVRRVSSGAALETGAPADRSGAPADRLTPPSARRPLVALLAALAVLGIAGSILFGLAWSNARSASGSQNAAAASARSLVLALTNFDPGTVSADFQRIQSMSAGSFASQAQRFFASSIGKELSAAGAASRGRIVALDVQWVNGSQASVFAVVSQTYLNDRVKAPIVDTLRLVIGLRDTSGNWLVSSVQVLQQPVSAAG